MSKELSDTGFGAEGSHNFKRSINSDGSYNIRKLGVTSKWKDTYKYLIEISWGRFFCILLGFYICLNVIFTLLYWCVGFENISGINHSSEPVFMQVFFFSAQTFTTVGYGAMAPTNIGTQMLSSIEAFTGFLSFSLMTGLLYGRFSKPVAKIIFSENAVIAPYKGITSLQIKLANARDNVLMNVTAKMILILNTIEEGGEIKKHYYLLPLEVSEISLLPLSWTVVHPIDDQSPLYKKTSNELLNLHGELLVIASGYDEVFSQTINARTSYYSKEILWNRKFKKIFAPDEDGNLVIDLADLNKTEIIP